jgi:hypothetical protein
MHAKPAPGRPQYTVSCTCGAKVTLDARAFGRPRVCKSCGGTLTVAWGRDPKTQKTVPIAMAQGPRRAAAPAGKSPFTAFCGCGYSRPVPASEVNTTPKCPGCGKLMVVEKMPDPKSLAVHKSEKPKPSQPLLPLHLRPPLRVRIRPGAQFFECPCGERLLLRTGAQGRPIQCPACDRFHIVEVQDAPPAGPSPAARGRQAPRGPAKAAPPPAPEPPRPPPPPSRALRLGEFVCKCGEIQPPRTSRTGREFACPKCGRKGRVEEAYDPKTKTTALNPVYTLEPASAPVAVAPPPAAAQTTKKGDTAFRSREWTCVCGRTIEAAEVLSKQETSCPGCGRRVSLEKWRHPHSTMTRIRPVFSEQAPATPPPTAPADEEAVSFEELTEPMEFSDAEPAAHRPVSDPSSFFEISAEAPEDDSPVAIPADAQVVICECGAELFVSQDDVGRPIQCPACSAVMTVESFPDRATGTTSLRVRSIGMMDQGNWTLDDFK